MDAKDRNKINAYTCPACGYRTVTIDRDEGVTPFMLGCRAPMKGGDDPCEGMATSAFYKCEQWLVPEWEWYKPDAKEMRGMSPAMQEHCQRGGLNIRRIAREAGKERGE